MLPIERYFDYAATGPVDPVVAEAMRPFFSLQFGNANSLHGFGREATHAVDLARRHVAEALGGEPEGVFFTSGATESNNWILQCFDSVAISPFEHSSLWEPAQALGITILGEQSGAFDLVSIMRVNNETGSLYAGSHREKRFEFSARYRHEDWTQAIGKIPVRLDEPDAPDFVSFSAHKIGGPKGVGVLFASDPTALTPLLRGGEQEMGLRAGTLNVPGIVGLGAACQRAVETQAENYERAQQARDAVLTGLEGLADWRINGTVVSPFILSIGFAGVQGETVALEVDQLGYAISSGAACSSRSTEPSHVLTAMGLESEWIRGTVRVSFGAWTTLSESEALGRLLCRVVEHLRRL